MMNSKKKHLLNPQPPFCSSKWNFSLFLLLFIFVFYFFHAYFSQTFQPVLTIHQLSLLPTHNSRFENSLQLKLVDRILFPDHLLLLVSKKEIYQSVVGFECVYQSSSTSDDELALARLSVDEYNDLESIVRCPSPPANYSAMVNLRWNGLLVEDKTSFSVQRSVHSWDGVVYGAVLDGKTAVVFVKGLNLRADRASDASYFSCHFGLGNSERTTTYVLTTKAVTAAQEVVRCLLPTSLWKLPAKAHGVRITIGVPSSSREGLVRRLPSVAKLIDLKSKSDKYELCMCTMVWNQASSLREWITYHSWLGVQRWFIYDNNSEDDIKQVVDDLDRENFNVSRHVWPWIKTQEAGFSHCALQAKNECKWVGFIDVDEYFYFPVIHRRPRDISVDPGRNSLRSVVAHFSDSTTIGELRTTCHSFGPSGLSTIPPRGVTVGYTCRLQRPERHKSIVRPDVLDDTLLTVVHHFHLRPGYRSKNLPERTAVINHYKYQVWESFRAKFYRRVATYVTDWQENQNEGSRDRAPGLGTEAIEPSNWPRQFCEVWDTGLRDFIMANLVDQDSGMLPWERPLP